MSHVRNGRVAKALRVSLAQQRHQDRLDEMEDALFYPRDKHPFDHHTLPSRCCPYAATYISLFGSEL